MNRTGSMKGRPKGNGYIFKRRSIYYLQYDVNGNRKVVSLGCKKFEDAEEEAKKYLPVISEKNVRKIAEHIADARFQIRQTHLPMREVWKEFERTTPNISNNTLGDHKRNWDNFESWVSRKYPHIAYFGELTDKIADDYMNHVASTGVHAETYNKKKRTLSIITDGLPKKYGTEENFWKKIKPRRQESLSRENLNREQLAGLFEILDKPKFHILYPKEIRVLFTLGAYTGMRLIDCCMLKWVNIDQNRKIISFVPRKTARGYGKRLNLPMHSEIEKQLHLAQTWKTDDYVLPNIAERYGRNPHGVKKDVVRVFKECGFKTSEVVEGRKQPRSIYGFHSLRHSFVSFCAAGNVPMPVVQSIVGHGSPAITRHYIHMGEDAVKQALKALPSGKPESTLEQRVRETVKYITKSKRIDNNLKSKLFNLLGIEPVSAA